MLAISTLENDGTTEAELDELAAIRKPTVKAEPGSLQEMVEKVKNPEIKEVSSEEATFLIEKERPLTKDNRPPTPFKSRVRREEDSDEDDDFNPFEDIATRAPPTTAPQIHRLLNRNQILGISSSRPVHHYGVPHQGEMSEKGWMHPKRRKPYIDIDWSKPLIVQLPVPPQ
ncbi:hypothetical protein FO519_003286 [Halicephalobus sp. NKZ332]|nr:hypothetical protein FO519_003286 [Halicephalobus sp. NKZ332]